MSTSSRYLIAVVVIVLAGCTTLAVRNLDALYGPASPKEYVAATTEPAPALEYERDIRPMMEGRCLVCHGCYDAPCQLKLDSYAGLLRGANPDRVYNASRLTPAEPHRLFEDAETTAQWRQRGFHAVLNERGESSQANLQAGLLARILDLKQRQPQPGGKVLPDALDFSLERTQQCPTPEQFDAFAAQFPLWGMPYGLPALSAAEHRKFKDWLALGAPASAPRPLSPSLAQEATQWEQLFNGDSLKHQLVARYLYEHLYLARLYLEDAGADTQFFRVVRSRTPPGQPLDVIATRRPYDDPGVGRVYYRLWRDPTSVVAKTHMPYRLSAERRERWRTWFIDPDYTIARLPGYAPETASNPFVTFEAIPFEARHTFLLDEAQFTVMNFIKGPVCRGSVALNVIRDRFWVFFTPPRSVAPKQVAEFIAAREPNLRLPAEAESGIWSITHWLSYAHAQRGYLQAKGEFIRANLQAYEAAQLQTFWDGGGFNPNAALTVFRHNDSATVVQGLVGEPPQTAWLIDYPILERIHYLLVAGFDVYGAASHQAMTRMYMDFLRMEAEMNFVAYLPPAQRKTEVANWYRGAADSVHDYLDAYFGHGELPTPYAYKTDQPKLELLDVLRARMARLPSHRYELEGSGLAAETVTELQKLRHVRGVAASLMPQIVIIKVNGHGLLTLLSDSAYTNISSMFNEAERRIVAEDALTIVNGVIGAYPDVFLRVEPADIPALVRQIGALRTVADYVRLLDRFGVRRTNPDFWLLSDQVLAEYRKTEPITSGVLDYSRYDNR